MRPEFHDLSYNQRRLLSLVRKNGPVSRAELSNLSGLTPGAVSRHCRELLHLRLIDERERRSGQRGQPALPIVIEGGGGIALGVSLAFMSVDVVAIDYVGGILASLSIPLDLPDQAALLAAVDHGLDSIAEKFAAGGGRLVGLGLALPGRHGDPAVEPFLPGFMQWLDRTALLEHLGGRFGGPVWAENLANTAALAEYYAEPSVTLSDLSVINLSHGIACGSIISGRIHRGVGGYAGEIGRLFPPHEPRPSVRDLVTSFRSSGRPVPTVEALGAFDPATDPLGAAWTERAARQIYPLARTISLLLAPELIVLTGMLPPAFAERVVAQIEEGLTREQRADWFPRPPVVVSRLGSIASAVGAAWLPIHAESAPNNGNLLPAQNAFVQMS
jgi:predicted NBD/HSP70 family sugar kinase